MGEGKGTSSTNLDTRGTGVGSVLEVSARRPQVAHQVDCKVLPCVQAVANVQHRVPPSPRGKGLDHKDRTKHSCSDAGFVSNYPVPDVKIRDIGVPPSAFCSGRCDAKRYYERPDSQKYAQRKLHQLVPKKVVTVSWSSAVVEVAIVCDYTVELLGDLLVAHEDEQGGYQEPCAQSSHAASVAVRRRELVLEEGRERAGSLPRRPSPYASAAVEVLRATDEHCGPQQRKLLHHELVDVDLSVVEVQLGLLGHLRSRPSGAAGHKSPAKCIRNDVQAPGAHQRG